LPDLDKTEEQRSLEQAEMMKPKRCEQCGKLISRSAEYAKRGDREDRKIDVWDVKNQICCTYVALMRKAKQFSLAFIFVTYCIY